MKYILITLILIGLTSCKAQEKDCSKFRTGTFKYTDPELKDWIIIRTDSVQIEENANSGRILKGKIKWHSDCQYTLIFNEVIPPTDHLIGKKVNVDILNTESNTYTSH